MKTAIAICFMVIVLGATAQTNKLSKDEYIKRYQDGVHQAQINTALIRERQAVEKTGWKLKGEVVQITEAGMLFRPWRKDRVESDLVFVQDNKIKDLTDGEFLDTFTVYPIGTYRYATAGNSTKTVFKYTVSLDKAVDWTRKAKTDQSSNQ